MNSRRVAASVANRVRHQVLKELFQLEVVYPDTGKLAASNHRAALFDGRIQARQGLVENLVCIALLRRFLRPNGGVRISSEIFQKLFHAQGTLDNVADILIATLSELLVESPPQHLAVGRDHSQRFLKIVRS